MFNVLSKNVPSRPSWRCPSALLLAALAAACFTAVPAHAQRAAGFDQRLASLAAKARGGRKVRVIVKVAGERAAAAMLNGRADVATRARGFGATGIKQLGDLPMVAMTVDENALARLAADGAITDVHKDLLLAPTLDTTIPLIGADRAHLAGITGIGNAGQGVIAILDTGVDRTHPDLNVIYEACISTNDGTYAHSTCPGGVELVSGTGAAVPCVAAASAFTEVCQHGTHVAGIAAGTHGVAPDAPIAAINVFTRFTDTAGHTNCADAGKNSPCMLASSSDLIGALQLVGVLESTYNMAAVNMSLGGGSFTGACDSDPAASVINSLTSYMAVVAAAGNDGWTNAIGAPACITSVIAVGNTTDADSVAVSSNAGHQLDLWAPGTNVWSAIPGGGTDEKDGTSMAAPHVAGAFALMRQIDPAITVSAALLKLLSHGVSVSDTRAGGMTTRPRLNVYGAVRELADFRATPEANEQVGRTIAAGDFNNDGIDDLVFGSNQQVGTHAGAGAVDVYYGTPNGPGILQVWTQTAIANGDGSEAGDGFGQALAVGDFDDDGFDDLAMSAPNEDVDGVTDCGAVHVIYGSATGLTKTGSNYFSQNSSGMDDSCSQGDKFGLQLASGDFNGDDHDDLVVGIPYKNSGGVGDSGAVHLIYGSGSGLSPTAVLADKVWSQSGDVENSPHSGDVFGWTLAAGDFNDDGHDDLAIGVLREDVGSVVNAGAVNVMYGSSASGLNPTTFPDQLFTQTTIGLDPAETEDRMGTALAAGDFDADGRTDLAIGILNESVGTATNAGAVHVLYSGGPLTGLTVNSADFWTQTPLGTFETSETNDRFGSALAAGDFNDDGVTDLAIGARGDNSSAGVANVLFGTFTFGLHTGFVPPQVWNQASTDVPDDAWANDEFGDALAVGDFNGDGRSDLAIGVPLEELTLTGPADAGAVHVLYQSASNVLTGTGSAFVTE